MSELTTRFRRLAADTHAALTFFSRLPLRPTAQAFDLRRSSAAWPLAGLLLALAPAALFWLCATAGMPSLLPTLLSLALLTALTGGLHEDGLADTADGLGGGRTRDAKLAIMRDSRIGTYGVLALGFTIGGKVAALASFELRPAQGALALVAAAAISRGAALWHWSSTLPARRDGLAWAAGRPDGAALMVGSAIAGLAGLAAILSFGAPALVSLVLAITAVALLSRSCVRQIGGHTGDTIGAAQQVAETAALIGLSLARAPIGA